MHGKTHTFQVQKGIGDQAEKFYIEVNLEA